MARVILVDLDDTLFDRGAAFVGWAEQFVAARPARFSAARRADDVETLAAIDARGRTSRREVAREIVSRFGLDEDPGRIAARLSSELVAYVTREPGVTETVAALARRAPLAVVTNGRGPIQRAKLVRLGLDAAFGAVIVSGEVGCAKPGRGIFERALAWAGCDAADALMIGDDLARDVEPARAMGMATLWIDRASGQSLASVVAHAA